MATLLVPVYFVLNILSWFSMFSAFRTTILSHYQVVLFCCWAYQWTYCQVGAWWPTYSITPTLYYSISVWLTFHIYPLTSSGRILTCRSLNLKVWHLSSGPHSKTCVPFLVYRTIRRQIKYLLHNSYMQHLHCVISDIDRRKVLIFPNFPSNFHLIWAACHRWGL